MFLQNSDVVRKFIFFYLFIYGCLCEPHCSKFPYEEALLEKMVRLEFRVEQMDNGFKNMEKKVSEELDKLHQQRESLNGELGGVVADVSSKLDQIQSFKSNITEENELSKKETLKMIAENLQHYEAQIGRLSMDLQNMQNQSDSKTGKSIYFRASSPHDRDPERDEKIIFTVVLDNKGDAYNKDTGVFTAPVQGTYLFSCQVCGKDPHDIRIAFVQDGEDKQPFQSTDASNYSCGTSVFVGWLDAGSEVWVKSIHGHATGAFYADPTMKTIFTGVFLD